MVPKKTTKKMTEDEKLYEELRQAWNEKPFALPKSPEAMKLFKYFFRTREEVEVAKHVECRLLGGRSKTAAEIAKECGKDVKSVKEILERLESRACIVSDEKKGEPGVRKFVQLGIWGILDFMEVLNPVDGESIVHRELAKQYDEKGGLNEWAPSKFPFWRTLIVDKNIEANSKVLTYELAGEIIKANDKFAVAYCGCRVKHRKCNHRIDTCLFFGSAADTKAHHSTVVPGARPVKYITKKQALELLDDCLKEGLIPMTFNNNDPKQSLVMCMCCTCCCQQLGGYATGITGWGNPYQIMKTNFQPKTDREKCRLCLKCVELCPVKARWHHWPHHPDLSDDFIFLEEERCIGCGLCAYHCPEQAITMERVRELTPEPDLVSMFDRMHREGRH